MKILPIALIFCRVMIMLFNNQGQPLPNKTFMHVLRIIIAAFVLYLTSLSLPSAAQVAGDYSLNGIWSFKIDPKQEGEQLKWYQQNYDPCGWDSLTVPGNWDVENR